LHHLRVEQQQLWLEIASSRAVDCPSEGCPEIGGNGHVSHNSILGLFLSERAKVQLVLMVKQFSCSYKHSRLLLGIDACFSAISRKNS
jgi:hypothetical protein